jgi:Uma2 family endonuclease
MGMPVSAPKEWTYEMLQTLPDDGNRHEIIAGELLVTPPPNLLHQRIHSVLFSRLVGYLGQYPIGQAFSAPGDVIVDPRNVVEPDIFVVPPGLDPWKASWKDIKLLLLAIEIISPSTARADRNLKRLLYQQFQVPEYWIVDADARMFERWRPSDTRAETLFDSIEWQPLSEYPAMRIDIGEFFATL